MCSNSYFSMFSFCTCSIKLISLYNVSFERHGLSKGAGMLCVVRVSSGMATRCPPTRIGNSAS